MNVRRSLHSRHGSGRLAAGEADRCGMNNSSIGDADAKNRAMLSQAWARLLENDGVIKGPGSRGSLREDVTFALRL